MATVLRNTPLNHQQWVQSMDHARGWIAGDPRLLQTHPDARRLAAEVAYERSLRVRRILARLLFAVLFLGVLALLGYEAYVLLEGGRLWPQRW